MDLYCEANSRDGGEESFQDEACGNDDDTVTKTTTVAWQVKKINNR